MQQYLNFVSISSDTFLFDKVNLASMISTINSIICLERDDKIKSVMVYVIMIQQHVYVRMVIYMQTDNNK